MGVLAFVLIVLLLLGIKVTWMSGYVAGTMHEVKFWLDAIDKLMVPNWQSLPVTGDDESLTPEQSKSVNQVYVSAYALALYTIKTEIAEARREAIEKIKAKKLL
jgi:hypothetical protein